MSDGTRPVRERLFDRWPDERGGRPVSSRAALAVVALVAAAVTWSWQPAEPLTAPSGGTTTAGLVVGERVDVPELGPRAALTVVRVEPVWDCDGRWWTPRFSDVLFSGPVTRVTVVARGVPDRVGVVPQDAWAALNVAGAAYTGETACECDGSCEASPEPVDGGEQYTVVLRTGGTLSGLAFTGAPGRLLRWDL
ncbi:hypothetical protein [Cellulomonas cellasea]|uniref:Uncharacterized protein n=2 Tax=Cellulomonas cellasea TaxID=43670 RepID=A0A0A0B7B2_9CELL|nr:hypothetical protein [Cellulomonas cellasea]KGM01126.1 hypothetical protein Q760_03715 [Cellulomonas cellasea DSM 20118]GEA87546.1 hypothetical protein CCE01nite_14950 [Cellulomonas cellasea]